MIRHIDGRKPTHARLAREIRRRELMAFQLDLPPECDECGSETCEGACLRMAEAKIAQARVVIHDLTHALREVAPEHPVLDGVACFVWAGE